MEKSRRSLWIKRIVFFVFIIGLLGCIHHNDPTSPFTSDQPLNMLDYLPISLKKTMNANKFTPINTIAMIKIKPGSLVKFKKSKEGVQEVVPIEEDCFVVKEPKHGDSQLLDNYLDVTGEFQIALQALNLGSAKLRIGHLAGLSTHIADFRDSYFPSCGELEKKCQEIIDKGKDLPDDDENKPKLISEIVEGKINVQFKKANWRSGESNIVPPNRINLGASAGFYHNSDDGQGVQSTSFQTFGYKIFPGCNTSRPNPPDQCSKPEKLTSFDRMKCEWQNMVGDFSGQMRRFIKDYRDNTTASITSYRISLIWTKDGDDYLIKEVQGVNTRDDELIYFTNFSNGPRLGSLLLKVTEPSGEGEHFERVRIVATRDNYKPLILEGVPAHRDFHIIRVAKHTSSLCARYDQENDFLDLSSLMQYKNLGTVEILVFLPKDNTGDWRLSPKLVELQEQESGYQILREMPTSFSKIAENDQTFNHMIKPLVELSGRLIIDNNPLDGMGKLDARDFIGYSMTLDSPASPYAVAFKCPYYSQFRYLRNQ